MSKSLNFSGARKYLCRVPFNKFDVDSADSKLKFVFFLMLVYPCFLVIAMHRCKRQALNVNGHFKEL